MPEPLTQEEITILTEALDAWVSKDFGGEVFGTLLGAMLMKEDQPGYAEYQEKQEKRRADAETARALRNEQSTLLKGKLIQMRRALANSAEMRV